MSLLSLVRVASGEVGILPGSVKMISTDNLATVTAAGYLKTGSTSPAAVIGLSNSDIVECLYSYNLSNGSGTFANFQVSISNSVITLVETSNPGDVLLPVVSGDVPVFNGTTGQIKDSGAALSNTSDTFFVMSPGSLTIGNFPTLGDANGTLTGGLPPSAASQAYVVVSPGSLTTGHILATSDAHGTLEDGGLAANTILTSAIVSPDVSIDLVAFDVACSHTALATGGAVTLIASSGSKQYKIRSLWINSGGTNFSGGGDRLGQVTDGTTVYSLIPATDLQTLINDGWGTTPLPYPAAAAINTSTVAGASLTFKYSGGTTDYTAGSIVVSGIAQRVA